MNKQAPETGLARQIPVKSDGLKDFLLSLINVTLVLAIILAIAGTVLVHKVHSFTVDVISEVKVGLLRDMDKDIRLITRAFQDSERDLKQIAARLDAIIKSPEITLSPEIRQDVQSLRTEVTALNQRLGELSSSREALSDHAIRTLASATAQAYIEMRACRVEAVSVSARSMARETVNKPGRKIARSGPERN